MDRGNVIVLNNLYDFLPVVLMFIKVVNFLPLRKIPRMPSSACMFSHTERRVPADTSMEGAMQIEASACWPKFSRYLDGNIQHFVRMG
jgi:hypothetical protein